MNKVFCKHIYKTMQKYSIYESFGY